MLMLMLMMMMETRTETKNKQLGTNERTNYHIKLDER